jgi:hypothetical protein
MDLEKITYQDLLQYIDALRSQGKSDNHPDMLKAKWKLREFLGKTKEKSTSIVPKLKSIKTVTLNQVPEDITFNKFVILGMAFAVVAILYKFKS